MVIVNKAIIHLFTRLGFHITYKKNKKFIAITDYSQAIYCRGDVYFEIDTRIACNFNQFFFDHRHWHYHTKTVEEIIKNPEIQYKDSILKKFYCTYQPRTFRDLYFLLKEPVHVHGHDEVMLKEDLNQYKYDPWSDVRQEVKMDHKHEYGLLRSHGTQHYGPVSDVKGELELARLKDTYHSIRKEGHQPEKHGFMKGYFLKYKDNYRFMIMDGNHRAAVLCAMKYEKLPVTFVDHFPRVIDYQDIANFPHVRSGLLSENLVRHIFTSYFEDNGVQKAKKLGLT